jgi:hypothetical protein
MGDGEKTNALRDAGFAAVANAHAANAARTAEAIWASVDELHAENAARLGAPVSKTEGDARNDTRSNAGDAFQLRA